MVNDLQNPLFMPFCQSHFNDLYSDVKPVFQKTHQSISETYGEILFEAVCKLIQTVDFIAGDIFVDLGSGLGKVTVQIFLQTLVRKSIGIEIVSDLHLKAQQVKNIIHKKLPEVFDNQRHLEFILGNFLEVDWWDATIILIGSPCFSISMLECLQQRLIHSKVRLVITLKPFLELQHYKLVKIIRLECSWDSCLCYIYLRA